MGIFDLLSSGIQSWGNAALRSKFELAITSAFKGIPKTLSFSAPGNFKDNLGVIATNDGTNIFLFALQSGEKWVSAWINPTNIVSVDLTFNFNQQGTTRVGGNMGAAVMGAALLGVTGAVIGSSSARDAKTQGTLREASGVISIYTTDAQHPVLCIELSPAQTAREWHARLSSLVGRASDFDSPGVHELIKPLDPKEIETYSQCPEFRKLVRNNVSAHAFPQHILLSTTSHEQTSLVAQAVALHTGLEFVGWNASAQITSARLSRWLFGLPVDGYDSSGRPGPTAKRFVVLIDNFHNLPSFEGLASVLTNRELRPDPNGGVSWLPNLCMVAATSQPSRIPKSVKDCFPVQFEGSIESSNGLEQAKSSLSVADELLKCKQLLDAGVLSDEEFRAAKARILAA